MNDEPPTYRRKPRTRTIKFAGRPSRATPLSDAARALRASKREPELGPYETRYTIQDGYGSDRQIVRP